ncbi:uncharacterized protein K452DRAFT_289168 [Aplosporella prunicola CBS 121167]|uniref:AA1-like domain-containing protein n=1 Tax=Aplosporella prunicola CBS 121167 TaxID=1176127 RepID=A0A6A6B888_9PEZI|nr:uncharacterized protein K452DRAFT_289168 [Aplosporella prunicola CBS 121167]KAF2140432.1 hypothetical protein K452DRAFT_289168 [Aplosporella prunicola CBS 121167]
MAYLSFGIRDESPASPGSSSCITGWDYRRQPPLYYTDCSPNSYKFFVSSYNSNKDFDLEVRHTWEETNNTGKFTHEKRAKAEITSDTGSCGPDNGGISRCTWPSVKLEVYNDTVTPI